MSDLIRPPLTAFVNWRKSTGSGDDGACVEIASGPGGWSAVRDSKDRGGAVLMFSAPEWSAFLAGIRKGEFDL
jgi:Domain of unknown function (DUF397)